MTAILCRAVLLALARRRATGSNELFFLSLRAHCVATARRSLISINFIVTLKIIRFTS
jgi:hypothetical protein